MKILLMALVVAGMVGTLTPTQAQAAEGPPSGERVEDVNSDKEEPEGEERRRVWNGGGSKQTIDIQRTGTGLDI